MAHTAWLMDGAGEVSLCGLKKNNCDYISMRIRLDSESDYDQKHLGRLKQETPFINNM